jgi:hypothetical protein
VMSYVELRGVGQILCEKAMVIRIGSIIEHMKSWTDKGQYRRYDVYGMAVVGGQRDAKKRKIECAVRKRLWCDPGR